MTAKSGRLFARLLGGASAITLLSAGVAYAEPADFSIAPQPLAMALNVFSEQSGRAVLLKPELADALTSKAVDGSLEPEIALAEMLQGTGLSYRKTGDTFLIVQGGSSAPQGASAAGGGAEVEALIVTAQKREEDIQDVPIAISAFTQESLDAQKIEGGFDLLKAIPNVTFSKNNFTSYNFSIRGVGTKAVSATSDPGVAVAFNNTPVIQNRLFEQEYFDLERVEVLRGPQGTLYGRNATSGVINVITAKPDLDEFKGWIKGEVGNYDTKRLSAMMNVPLIEDKLAVRFAGALTDRQGYDYNLTTKNAVNGRSLWSGRVTLGFEPTESFRGNLIWERFEEEDNRSRTGKQLCHRDDGPEEINGVSIDANPAIGDPNSPSGARNLLVRRAVFAQGCKAGSLYDPMAFGTPNGLSYNFILGAVATRGAGFVIGQDPTTQEYVTFLKIQDPYAGMMQSPSLREIASIRDPVYRAAANLVNLNLEFDLSDSLTLSSQTAYVDDETYSFQDYNRFNTVPIFTDTANLGPVQTLYGTGNWKNLAPGGVFCDPQLGCSNTMAGFDIAQAKAKQFNQELRLSSDFDGPLNFSVGANYTRFETLIDYYVMYNLITAFANAIPFNLTTDGQINSGNCFPPSQTGPVSSTSDPNSLCPYIDPNPVESIDGEGHNYFRSKNPYKLKSSAVFGEAYWEVADGLKVTAGLRYTKDQKRTIPVPTQILLAPGLFAGGVVAKGYPEDPEIAQEWGEWTGRLGIDWRPELSFTDKTMFYAFYSHGYKGGGTNPPSPDFADEKDYQDMVARGILTQADVDFGLEFEFLPALKLTAVEYDNTFDPEFVDAFEVGAKNTLLGGAMTLNATAFLYDYDGYQVSQIRDRTAVNENFDARIWGLELESLFSPTRNLQIVANIGYLNTHIADGERSIDIMDRTQGDPNYVVAKPWAQLPSNCVVPAEVASAWLQSFGSYDGGSYWGLCGGVAGFLGLTQPVIDPATGQRYDPLDYPEINGGAGLLADLGGNELPNAPHWTANIGVQYGWDVLEGWRATVRSDVYWQSQSWHRVYNDDPYDKLHGWYNANLSVSIERPDDALKIELYAKNLLNDTPITDAFLNSDDTGLTTNVFVLDPRLIGLSIRKGF